MGTPAASPVGARVRKHRRAWVLLAPIAALALALPVFAVAPIPAPGVAVIDGDPGEWTAADFFADMKHEGSTKVVGSLSLRYDCESGVLSALVTANDGVGFLVNRPENAYVRIDGVSKIVDGESGNDGTPPDFAWVGVDGDSATGYEASGLVEPGEHTIRVHVLMFDDSEDGYLTIDSDPRTGPLTLDCGGVGAATGSPSNDPSDDPSADPTDPGEVLAATGVPITPPPTDMGDRAAASPLANLWLVMVGLALINGAVLLRSRGRAR